MEGNAHCLLKWSDPWRTFFHSHWLIHCGRKRKAFAFAYAVSGCIGAALLLAMVISGAVGTCIPLFFKKINVDPAVASGPLITTVNDLVAVISYYGLSWVLLINIMHLAG